MTRDSIMSAESRIAQEVAERQVMMFSMFVGPGTPMTRAALSVRTGIPESTLKSYANGAAMPLHVALVLRKFLPREAMNMLTEPGDVRFTPIEQSEACWDGIAAAASGLVAEVCVARSDGKIDHVEAAKLKTRARAVIAQLSDAVDEYASDIVERRDDILLHDATDTCAPIWLPPGVRLSVVTNPPFKIAEAITRRMLALTDHRVCILQQLSFLASAARHRLFTEFPPSDVLILSRRPSMPPGAMISEMGAKAFKGGTTDFCWIVWTKPHDRETRTRWLSPVIAA